MPTSLQLAFAGVWSMVFHWGLGLGLILLLLAAAFFTTAIPIIGPYLTNARKDLLWAAFGVAVFMAGQALGAHDEKKRNTARQVVIEKTVDKAVQKTTTPQAKARKDKFDRPEN